MAARKKSKALAVKKKNELATGSWDDEMAKYAKEIEHRETSETGQWISGKGGEFSYGEDILGDSIIVVVLDYIFDNAYYSGVYDPDNIVSPDCFALTYDEKELQPHEDSEDPQADECKGCAWNEFKSDVRKKGKACKNSRRLAIVPVDEDADEPLTADAEIAFLRIPPASIKYWKSYVNKIYKVKGLPPMGVVTELTIERDPAGNGYTIKPVLVDDITSKSMRAAVLALREQLGDDLLTPYQKIEEEEEPKKAKKSNKKTSKKKVSKKTGGKSSKPKRRKF